MTELPLDERTLLADMIAKGDPLPPEYKHILFPPDRQEYELVYANKEREVDILATTMRNPLQPIRDFGDTKTTTWRNMLVFGDNLQATMTLLRMKEEGSLLNSNGLPGVKLVYIDPPFATRREFQASQGQRAYQDRIAGAQFLEFLRKRLIVLRELLSDDGSIYVHLDWKKVHAVKLLMDEIFGVDNFRNEIIWHYRTGNVAKRQFQRKHDTILFYSKTSNYSFKVQQQIEYYAELYGPKKKIGFRGKRDFEDEYGKGRISDVDDVWNLSAVFTIGGEHIDYPTQKPEILIQRIVQASSAEGDVVLDSFAGSGTTLAVAEKLGRRWIGIDSSKLASYTIQRRLLNVAASKSLDNDKKHYNRPPRPFTLYNSGLYDFSRLRELPWNEWRSFVLRLFECEDSPHRISGVALDGFRSGADVLIFNHMQEGGVILDHGFVDDFHTQIGSHVGTSVFIIAPAASVAFLEDYIEKGITRYYILRIPYSIINELHNHAFESLLQPVDKSQVNSTVEAVGFDFIKQPLVECSYDLVVRDGKTTAQVYISTFRSEALAKGASFKGNREALSMVLVDLDYPFDEAKGSKSPPPFELDLTFYASLLENEDWIVRLPFEQLGNHIMLIYIDIYGNEYTEVKGKVEFDTVSLAQPKLEPNQNQSPVTGRTSAVLKPAKATTIEASADPVARTQSEAQAQGSPAPTGQDTVA